MKNKFLMLVVSLLCLLSLAGSSVAFAEEEKGIDQKDIDKVVKELKSINFGLLWYLSYMSGEGKDVGGSAGDGVDRNKFAVKRGYFRVTKEFMPWFEGHITLDVTQASIQRQQPVGFRSGEAQVPVRKIQTSRHGISDQAQYRGRHGPYTLARL